MMEPEVTASNLVARRTQNTPLADKSKAAEKEVTLPDGWETLPPDPNFKCPDYRVYRYRGTNFGYIHRDWGMMEQLEQFRGRSSDVIVASFPKSGTTWLQEIVWRVTHHVQMDDRRGVPIEFRFPMLELQSQKGLMEMTTLEKIAGPRFIKTHLPYHMLPESVFTSGAKVLYVSRDARDVCVSSYHMAKIIAIILYDGTFSEYRYRFMNGTLVYGPYREHVKGYLQHSDTVLCLTYEEMHQNREWVVRKVASFLDICLTDADVSDIVQNTSFEVMKDNPDTNFRHWEKTGMIPQVGEGTFMRKGVVGDWRNYFTEKENEVFMKWRNEEI